MNRPGAPGTPTLPSSSARKESPQKNPKERAATLPADRGDRAERRRTISASEVWSSVGWVLAALVIAALTYVLDREVPVPSRGTHTLAEEVAPRSPVAPAAAATTARQPLAWTDWFQAREDVRTMEWPSGEQPMLAVAAAREPVRIVGSPADGWPALHRWTPAYLAGKLAHRKDLPEVIISPTPQIVYYDDAKPVKEVPGFPVRMPLHERRAVPVSTFFEAIGNASDPTYMYWVGQKQRRNLYKWMEEDIQPTAPFAVDSSGSGSGSRAAGPNLQTWVGKLGLTSVVHYDASHNVYVQVYGEKTFVLFPPAAAPLFQICPFQHPGDGHSCLDWGQIEADAAAVARAAAPFSKPAPEHAAAVAVAAAAHAAVAPPAGWAGLTARLVRLQAGDVLYIPPYWLHHVVTTGTSEAMSVSMISKSRPQALMLQVEAYPLKFDHGWPRVVRVGAVVSLLHHLLDALGLRTSAGPAQLLQARYQAWLGSSEARKAAKALARDFTCQAPTPDVEAVAAAAGRDIGAIYRQVDDAGVQQILLFNYLEAMAHWAVVDGQLIPVMLRLMSRQCP